jgi:hypothetical protein
MAGPLTPTRLASWSLAPVGIGAALVAAGLDGDDARSSVAQVWSPFVLVAGVLLVGLVADHDGLFAALGHRLATLAPNDAALFGGAALTIAVVTALLNLDTSVAFLTPVLVHAARSRGQTRDSPADRMSASFQRLQPAAAWVEPHQSHRSRPPAPLRRSVPQSHGAALGRIRSPHRLADRPRRTPDGAAGSLAWILWWRNARAAGARPPVARAVMLGLVTVPLSMAVALAMLTVTRPL